MVVVKYVVTRWSENRRGYVTDWALGKHESEQEAIAAALTAGYDKSDVRVHRQEFIKS